MDKVKSKYSIGKNPNSHIQTEATRIKHSIAIKNAMKKKRFGFQKGSQVGKETQFKKGVYQGHGFEKGHEEGVRFKKGHTPWNKGKKLNQQKIVRDKLGRFKKGHKLAKLEKNPRWKGGRKISSKGYVLIKMRGHPNATYHGYIREHRLVMEKHLGRYLKPEEVVHHENGIRDDNRIKNLKLFKNQIKHKKYHERKPICKKIINFVLNTFKEKWKHIVKIITT